MSKYEVTIQNRITGFYTGFVVCATTRQEVEPVLQKILDHAMWYITSIEIVDEE